MDTSASGGPRQQLRRRGFPTRRAAQAVLTETLTNLAEQTYVAPSRLSFGEYVTSRWLPAIEGELRPSTFASYSRNLRLHVLPEVGRVSLQSLDAGTLTALYQRLARDGRKDHVHGTGLSARLRLPAIRLHDLRHTCATLALEAGVHPKVVQERLGHANVSITLDLYSHVAPALATDAATKVAALILGT